MNCLTSLLVALALTGPPGSQITIPAENARDKPIIGVFDASIPEGATVDGAWSKSSDAFDFREPVPGKLYLWGAPGNHWLLFQGYWVQTRKVTFVDGAGNTITINEYVGSGFIRDQADFKILGSDDDGDDDDDDDGDDDDDPPPSGPWQIMMFYDGDQLDNYPAAQRALLTSLAIRIQLKNHGHILHEILEKKAISVGVPSKYQSYVDAVKGDPLPRIALAPKDGGTVMDFPLPENREALQVLLNAPTTASYKLWGEEVSP